MLLFCAVPDPAHDSRLESEFSARVWARGVDYFGRGHVVELDRSPQGEGEWIASVQGSEYEPYQVWLSFGRKRGRPHLVGGCDCPAEFPCKHLAATLLAVREETAPKARERKRERRKTSDPLRDWLEAMRASAGPPRGAKQSGEVAGRCVFYVAHFDDVGEGEIEVEVEALVATRGPDGSPRKVDAGEVSLDPDERFAGVPPEDIALCQRAAAIAGTRGTNARRSWSLGHDEASTSLLRDLVSTGRCHLDTMSGPLLRLEDGRKARLAWHTDQYCDQTLAAFDAAPASEDAPSLEDEEPRRLELVPSRPLHYLDRDGAALGRVDLGAASELGPALARAPILQPEATRSVSAATRRRLEALGLPAPVQRKIRKVSKAAPTPVLELFFPDENPEGDPDLAQLRARLAFQYDMRCIPADYHPPFVTVLDEDEVLQIDRDVDAERDAARRLIETGLRPAPGIWHSRDTLAFDDAERWYRFLVNEVSALRHEGWSVEWPDELPLTDLTTAPWSFDAEIEGGEWFTVAIGVEVDGARVDVMPAVFQAILRKDLAPRHKAFEGASITLPLGENRWVELPLARLHKILDVLVELHELRPDAGRLRLPRADVARLRALDDMEWRGDSTLRGLAAQLSRETSLPVVRAPVALRGELRDYQQRGLEWLSFLRGHGFGGVLADDMGLGKTIQTLAHLLREKQARRLDRPCLVVAPRTVIHNWRRECERFAPSLRCEVYHGAGRAEVLQGPRFDVLVTTYALLTRDAPLRERPWHIVVLDEAQAIKNPETKVAEAARALDARQRLCLTGTPMENHLEELWSLFAFIAPGLLGGRREFRQHYRNPIERHGDASRMAALSARIAPFVLRRRKADVLTELPPKTEVLVRVPLEKRQRDLYESVRLTMEKVVREALKARGLARSRIVVLDALLKLRQVCCHPRLVKSDEARRAKAPSAKTDRLMELLAELQAEGRRALVFSQFTGMLDIVAAALDARGAPYQTITGRTRKRQALVDAFQEGEFPVLLVSLKAGGTGINLTRADTVIHYDPWWNPAVEAQATDRAHRIGQERPVTVYRLVCEGTVEERMLALQDRKRALTEALQQDAEQRSAGGLSLGPEDLERLLAPVGA